jgi:hypothetical protein
LRSIGYKIRLRTESHINFSHGSIQILGKIKPLHPLEIGAAVVAGRVGIGSATLSLSRPSCGSTSRTSLNAWSTALAPAGNPYRSHSCCSFGPHEDGGHRRWGSGDAIALAEMGAGQRYSIQAIQPLRACARQLKHETSRL